MDDGTHLIIIKNPKALEHLEKEETCCFLIAARAEKGKPVECGDAMAAKDELEEAGFVWGKDFYLKNVEE